MKRQRIPTLAPLVMLLGIAFTFSAIHVRAQPAVNVFKVGDRVEVNIANDVQNEDRWVQGAVTEIIYASDGRLLSDKVKMDGSYVRQFQNLARVVRPLNQRGDEPAQTTPAPTSPPRATPAPTAAPKQADTNGDCSFDTYPEVKSSVTVVPGRGAQRKQDGAPVNEKIYPFKAKYIVCRKYSRITRTQYESDFVCFLDRGGNWSCPVDGVPKITHWN
ncbi:MAG: hypothetical protein M3Z32_07700 [Acidobacteriota bacterium]|nr:hypothetical protein [Acidobacteriota bacterium]